MEHTVYEFDPGGDVLLILRNPNASFADWRETQEPPTAFQAQVHQFNWMNPEFVDAGNKIQQFQALDPGHAPTSLSVESAAHEEPISTESTAHEEPIPAEDAPLGESAIEDFSQGVVLDGNPTHDQFPAPENNNSIPCELLDLEVQMKLSSKHLIMASGYFNKMFQGPWKENTTHTVEASEWDIEAMLILMNIIHGHVRKVPRSISLEMLAKIAVLVDYYQCHEVAELHVDCWLRTLSQKLPEQYGRDLVLWLAISWVFSQKSIFQALAKVILEESSGPLDTLGLPIPQNIVETIDRQRQQLVEHMISGLHNLVWYFCGRTKCSFECSSILLGALTRQMHAVGFLKPQLTTPFLGYSIKETKAILRGFVSPLWSAPRRTKHGCNLAFFIGIILGALDEGTRGLNLEDLGST